MASQLGKKKNISFDYMFQCFQRKDSSHKKGRDVISRSVLRYRQTQLRYRVTHLYRFAHAL